MDLLRILIYIAVIFAVLFVLFLTIKKKIKKKISPYSEYIHLAKNVMEGLKEEQESNDKPLSVGGGDSIYLPMIMRDFPDYHPEAMAEKIKRFMVEYHESLENKDINMLNNDSITNTVREVVKSQINDLGENRTVKFDNIKVHAAAISAYSKTAELATVRYQTALEYINEINKKIQTKYDVDITYVFKDTDNELFGLNCQNCGAPLDTTRTKCLYCGTEVVRNIDKVWRISNFRKLKQVG